LVISGTEMIKYAAGVTRNEGFSPLPGSAKSPTRDKVRKRERPGSEEVT